MTADGGLRTGDLGRLDADGFLFITGRVKELYKLANGKYVAPAPLEEKLQLSPYIAQCVVYGADKPHNVALIVPDMAALQAWAAGTGVPANDRGAARRRAHARRCSARRSTTYSRDFKGYEAIRDFVLSAEELTTGNDMLTPTLKLKRRNVTARYERHSRFVRVEERPTLIAAYSPRARSLWRFLATLTSSGRCSTALRLASASRRARRSAPDRAAGCPRSAAPGRRAARPTR